MKGSMILITIIVVSLFIPLGIQATTSQEKNSVNLIVQGEGTSLNFDRFDIMKTIGGVIEIESDTNGNADVKATISEGDTILTTESYNIPVVRDVTLLSDNREVVTVDLSDYKAGTFVTIRCFDNGSAYVYLAADVADIQVSIVCHVEEMPPLFAAIEHVHESSETAASVNDQSPSTVPRISCHRNPGFKSPSISHLYSPRIPPIGPRGFCLVHDVKEWSWMTCLDEIGDWCVDESWIDYEIYRAGPSEAQMKSDLQYYNKKDLYREDFTRYVGAYQVSTHGADADEPDKSWVMSGEGYLTPSEVANLWYTTERYDVKPQDCILCLHVCNGLWDSDESSGAEMGNAFMNYGAKAFIAATDNISIDFNNWVEEFWYSLTYDDQTISEAIGDANIAQGWKEDNDTMSVYYADCGNKKLLN